MRTFIVFEWKRFWKDIKNIVAFLIFIALSLYMALGIEKSFEPVRSFDREPIEATYQDASFFLETRDPEYFTRSFKTFGPLQEVSGDLLKALNEKNYREAIVLEEEYQGLMNARYQGHNPRYFFYGGNYSDRFRWQTHDESTYHLYSQALLESDLYLTQEILEGKTLGQSLARSWMGAMPLLLIIVGLIYSIDFFARDNKHQSLAQTFPFTDYKKSWLRTGVVWLGTIFTLLVGEVVFVFALSFFRDFGGLDLWVSGINNQLTVISFLAQVHLLIFLAGLILLRLSSWIGQLFHSSLLSILLIPILGVSYLFDVMKKENFLGFFEFFPFSFIQPGNVVSGFQNFWHKSERFTFGHELLLLVIAFVFVELIIYFTFRMQSRKQLVSK